MKAETRKTKVGIRGNMVLKWKNKVTTRPADVIPGDAFGLKVVAVVGENNDWAAYLGPTDWPDDMVAEQGDKIPKEAAEQLFTVVARTGRSYRL